VDAALERYGRIDALINNAGIYIGKPFTEYTVEDFNAVIAVNLAGFFHITTRTIKHMLDRGRGHVVNVPTTLVEHANAKVPAALATLTRGGLTAVTRSLAIEYASRGLRANAVSRRHQDADVRRALLCVDRRIASGRAGGRDRGRDRRSPLSRVGPFRDGRDLAHRRRPKRGTLSASRCRECELHAGG
jgi:NAD(P)-dependent dehydrogenase (short-subunit alcohol dehydrogenase family)